MKPEDAYDRIAKRLGSVFLEVDPSTVTRCGLKAGDSAYLWGPVGVGKTQLAVCLLLDHGRFALDTMSGIINEARSTFNDPDRSERVVINRYKNAEYVLIDDLLSDDLTSYGKGVAMEIINHRWSNRLPTIITSNVSIPDLAKKVDDRMASRVADLCKPVKIEGKDRRV